MDFSLARVIEVIEERLGKRAGSALIILVALAIASWSVGAIFTNILKPSFEFAIKLAELKALSDLWVWVWGITRQQAVASIGWVTFVTIGSFLYLKFLNWLAHRRIRIQITNNPDKYLKPALDRFDRLLAQTVEDTYSQLRKAPPVGKDGPTCHEKT